MLIKEITGINSILKELGTFLNNTEFFKGGKKGDKRREKYINNGLLKAIKLLFTILNFKGKVLCLKCLLHDLKAN
jgi:hypothetical protein